MRDMKLTASEEEVTYVIKHTPVRYRVKTKFYFFHRIETLDGHSITLWSINGGYIQSSCDLLNCIYSHGYSVGVRSILRTMKELNY
jgi:hypothetical protein